MTSAAVKQQVLELGGAFMISREARAFGETTGVAGFHGAYARGRGGVLGDVDADVVTAAFGFFEPGCVRAAWESVQMPAADAAVNYMLACRGFGQRKLAAFEQSDRLAELLRRVVEAAPSTGLPLFAGWRAMPVPEDGRAAVLQLTHVLRELRGGLHLVAVTANGLTPLQAILVAGSPIYDGPGHAKFLGWAEPFETVTDDVRGRWEAAEKLTDELIAPCFDVLDEKERDELTVLMLEAHRVALSR
ncbi:SCO6745 family protein [Nocardia sp. IBHARD005]|uniref:SCO6745 family protein n=1 Tax=Nocardia sp. IBHARD005 TaxID=3457765 RepID=UPI0040596027